MGNKGGSHLARDGVDDELSKINQNVRNMITTNCTAKTSYYKKVDG
jgi:hypothetical protein